MKLCKVYLYACLLTLLSLTAVAQPPGILNYQPPAGWTSETGKDHIIFSAVQDEAWCRIAVYNSTASKGSAEKDFSENWKRLAQDGFRATGLKLQDPVAENGWTYTAGSGSFRHENAEAVIMLTNITGYGQNACILVLTNHSRFADDIEKLMGSVQLNKPVYGAGTGTQVTRQTQKGTSTTWPDGWTSTLYTGWVEVAKPGIRVLIHHPNEKTDAYQSDKLKGDYNAWDILLSPRYSRLSGLQQRGIQDYQSITFLTGDAIDNATGKKVHLVLFKKHYDQGQGRYLEVIADNQAVFEKEFGNNYINSSSWDYMTQAASWNKLADMQWRNKFAVTAEALQGQWGSGQSQTLSYYYTGSGGYAGATAASVADQFTFKAGNQYESDHSGASGVVGNLKFSRVTYKGSFQTTNWNIILHNRHQGASETYDAYLEAIKGGWILRMNGKDGYGFSLVKHK